MLELGNVVLCLEFAVLSDAPSVFCCSKKRLTKFYDGFRVEGSCNFWG